EVPVQEGQVAFGLAALDRRIAVAGALDADVGELDAGVDEKEGGHDLFVDAVVPTDVGSVPKQPDVVDLGGLLAGDGGRGARGHHEGDVFGGEVSEQGGEFGAVGVVHEVIGVEPAGPGTHDVAEAFMRAASKSSHQGKSKTRAPNWAAISLVRSVEPVSTRMISGKRSAMERRQFGRAASSFLAMMQAEAGKLMTLVQLV